MNSVKERLRIAQKEVQELRKRVEQEEAEEIAIRQEQYRPLAEKAHDLLCEYNHTDGCGWGYENDNWGADAHRRWLEKVEKILNPTKSGTFHHNPVTTEMLAEILDMVEKMKSKHSYAMRILYDLKSGY